MKAGDIVKHEKEPAGRVLTLTYHEPHEMARLSEGRHVLHFGNYWDFHAGCHGTVMLFKDGSRIDFKKEWTDRIRTPAAVAYMVANRIGASVVVKHRRTPFL